MENQKCLGAGRAFVNLHTAAELEVIRAASQARAPEREARLRAAIDEARGDLEAHHFALPRTIEQAEGLALAVELPEQVVWSGDFTIGDLRTHAARWEARIRAKLLSDRTAAAIAAGLPGPAFRAMGEVPSLIPNRYLFGWRSILEALDESTDEEGRRRLARLNDRYNGPILIPQKGSQPRADHRKLVEWWNRLEILWADDLNQQRGKALEAANQQPFGKTGLVVPDFHGGVKPRRGDRQANVAKGRKTSQKVNLT